MREFISFAEAQKTVLGSVSKGGKEAVHLSDAVGRTLAEDIISSENIPPFDNSAMDGFAVRSADILKTGTELSLIGEIAAGDDGSLEVRSGTCAAIMTGAPIPPGADAVIPIEKAQKRENTVRFDVVPSSGDSVRTAGDDLREGDLVITSGEVVTPFAVGVMASLGYAQVSVVSRPAVSVVTTGSELVGVDEHPALGQIRDSNGPTLAALVESAGGKCLGPWRARDERAVIRACLEEALEADVVLVSGGVSVGEYDLVKDELDKLGMELLFWKVRQRPGKPLTFGRLDGKPIFGLPGNPVSSTVCFEQYVRPALAKILGRRRLTRPLASGFLTESVPKVKGLHHFARGTSRWEDGKLLIDPAPRQGSHVASSLVQANGLIHLPEELEEARAGLGVEFESFDMQ